MHFEWHTLPCLCFCMILPLGMALSVSLLPFSAFSSSLVLSWAAFTRSFSPATLAAFPTSTHTRNGEFYWGRTQETRQTHSLLLTFMLSCKRNVDQSWPNAFDLRATIEKLTEGLEHEQMKCLMTHLIRWKNIYPLKMSKSITTK